MKKVSHWRHRLAKSKEAETLYSSGTFPFKDKMRTEDREGRIRE